MNYEMIENPNSFIRFFPVIILLVMFDKINVYKYIISVNLCDSMFYVKYRRKII